MKPSIALIVNTYNQPDYLVRGLKAISAQSKFPDEVILADDGSDEETRRLFNRWAAKQPFNACHVWHEKKGFRRARILNIAIARTQSDYIVFLDGDTIPHPDFVKDHQMLARRNFSIQGHRALVSQEASHFFGAGNFSSDRRRAFFSGQLGGSKHIFRWLFPFKHVASDLHGVRGCNMSVWRSDLININGYNENYTGWGCEDLDVALRLNNSGIRRLDVRGRALCYHLWHPLFDRSRLVENRKILAEAVQRGDITCKYGLHEHLTNQSPDTMPGRDIYPVKFQSASGRNGEINSSKSPAISRHE